MKKMIVSLAMMMFVSAGVVKAQSSVTENPNPNAPEITFETEVIDYGTIEHNSDGNREFRFKNTGKEPLIISNAQGSCGCTVPSAPKEPIKPGESNVIKVKYATDRVGPFEKTVTITSNAKTAQKVLKIKGNVKPSPNQEAGKAPAAPAAVPAPSETKTVAPATPTAAPAKPAKKENH